MLDKDEEPLSKKAKTEVCLDEDTGEWSGTRDIWLTSQHGYSLSMSDKEALCKGERLNDLHINFAQSILKVQFPLAEGLNCSLLQAKSVSKKIKSGLQIVHCRSDHWILASNMTCEEGLLDVYDSVYSTIDDGTLTVLHNLFEFSDVQIVEFQKQVGGSDCGLFSIAIATEILFDSTTSSIYDSTKLYFCQDSMRSHVLKCFEQGIFSVFPKQN